jgi:hypothetical protein
LLRLRVGGADVQPERSCAVARAGVRIRMSDFTVQEREEHVFAGRARVRRVVAALVAIALLAAAVAWLTGLVLASIQPSGLPPLRVPALHATGRANPGRHLTVQAPGGARYRVDAH